MTRVLAIDTAGPILGIALLQDGTLGHISDDPGARRHVEQIVPRIASTLSHVGWTTQELAAVAISAGPGSFTGLRVGMAAAKAIALAHGIPLISVDTLEALAATEQHRRAAEGAVPPPDLIVPVLDARKSRFYSALFENTPELTRLTPDQDLTHEELMHTIQHGRQTTTILWCAPGPMGDLLQEEPGYVAGLARDSSAAPGAALRGYRKLLAGAADSEYEGPFYLRAGDIGKAGTTPRFKTDHDSDSERSGDSD